MKPIILRSVLSFLLFLALSGFSHPFYFSLTQIDHNPQTKSLEITLKLFTNDLEEALESQGTGRLLLGDPKENASADRYIQTYLEKNLKLAVNGEDVAFDFLGKEVELDVTWCYVEVANIKEVERIHIKNTLLLEMFEEQQNVIQLKVGNQKKSTLLRRGFVEDDLTID